MEHGLDVAGSVDDVGFHRTEIELHHVPLTESLPAMLCYRDAIWESGRGQRECFAWERNVMSVMYKSVTESRGIVPAMTGMSDLFGREK